MTPRAPNACGHCGRAGHYRPTCPERKAAVEAAEKRVRETSARHPAPAPDATAPRAALCDGPWNLVASDRRPPDFVARFTWDHTDGRRVTATVPIPASGDPTDTTEGMIALRRPRDVFAYMSCAMPSAHVEVTSATAPAVDGGASLVRERPPAPRSREVVTDSSAWGMW